MQQGQWYSRPGPAAMCGWKHDDHYGSWRKEPPPSPCGETFQQATLKASFCDCLNKSDCTNVAQKQLFILMINALLTFRTAYTIGENNYQTSNLCTDIHTFEVVWWPTINALIVGGRNYFWKTKLILVYSVSCWMSLLNPPPVQLANKNECA